MQSTKVLIADDHSLVREGLSKIIQLDPALTVVGEAADGREAVQKAEELNPDVILMDLNMPLFDGLTAVSLIKKTAPRIRIVALTVEDREDKVIEVFRAGVDGYVLKDIEADALIWSIKAVHAGETVIHPNIVSLICRRLGKAYDEIACCQEGEKEVPYDLTPRELEVLDYIVRGARNPEIARGLFISEKTVKNHISNIFRKLQVEDRTQAALSAIKSKLININI